MIKIAKLSIKGIRGIREQLTFSLNNKSILIYGDNGSGKSSITDAFEWLYFGKIAHLSGEEISRSKSGVEALRNIFLNSNDVGSISIEFNEASLNSERNIIQNNDQTTTKSSNTTSVYKQYIADSQKENLILRHKDLANFILASKTDKLKALSDIIGFAEITNYRAILRSAVNDLKREIKIKDFDNKISTQQAHLIEFFGRNITADTQFLQVLNEHIKPLELDISLQSLDQLDELLKRIKKPDDFANIEAQSFYTKLLDFTNKYPESLNNIQLEYGLYREKALNIVSDVEKLSKIILENLLSEGLKVLQIHAVSGEDCPLCLQPKDNKLLKEELEERLSELKHFKNEKTELLKSAQSLRRILIDNKREIESFIAEKYLKSEDNKVLKDAVAELNTYLTLYINEIDKQINVGLSLASSEKLAFNQARIDCISEICKERIEFLKSSKKDDLKFDIHSKVALGKAAFLEIKQYKKEKEIVERHKISLELIYSNFLKKQEQGITSFLDHFSDEINKLYQFMNPGEEVDDIKLASIKKGDELAGITIQHKFYNKDTSPPQRFLSESHLNCLGIAYFLASVKAFNEKNGFLIIDDVISSFDTHHRKRFVELLIEQFSDYQIILLTHEKQWFDMASSIVRNKEWKVNQLKWTEEKGSHLEEELVNQREGIERKLLASDTSGLGNDIRKYLEQLLKAVAFNLKVTVEYRFNNLNEDRMSAELLTRLKGRLKKQPDSKFKTCQAIDRINNSMSLVNKGSHDTSINPSIGDYKAFWADITELEESTLCGTCKKYISYKYYDRIAKVIKCNCGSLNYQWND